ncbi:MAG TPA: hypothetical protein VGE09_08290 [Pseudoxanthomonas sp.]
MTTERTIGAARRLLDGNEATISKIDAQTVATAYLTALESMRKREGEVFNEGVEVAARTIEPKDAAPCDCIKIIEEPWWGHYCDCRNSGDADRAMAWCQSKNDATTIRTMRKP